MSHHDFRGHLRRGARKVWTTLLGERSLVQRYGSLRDRERWGLVRRPNYAYGILRAADVATFSGQSAVTVCEFGVASGGGLLNMIEIADLVSRDTGVTVRVVGFDNGEGLPEPQGYKDHPEIWSGGDFRIEDRDGLLRRTEGKAEIIFGDVAETVRPFAAGLDPSAPLGFIAIDVDIYSAARSAFGASSSGPKSTVRRSACTSTTSASSSPTSGAVSWRPSGSSMRSTSYVRSMSIGACQGGDRWCTRGGTGTCTCATCSTTRHAVRPAIGDPSAFALMTS